MKREIQFRPAFDKRNPDPKKNYGIHGVEVAFYLTGELGAMQFIVYTGWHLKHVAEELTNKHLSSTYNPFKPLPADVGYHSPKPLYEGQEPMSDECHILNGKCYYDGSSLMADDYFDTLTEEGSDGVWGKLENEYKERFGELR